MLAGSVEFVRHVQETRRPLVLTRQGRVLQYSATSTHTSGSSSTQNSARTFAPLTLRRYVDDYGIGPWQEFSGTVSGERVAYLLDWTGPTTVREVLESWARNVSCVTRERCATVDEADTQT
jgi:hypothetical protein